MSSMMYVCMYACIPYRMQLLWTYMRSFCVSILPDSLIIHTELLSVTRHALKHTNVVCPSLPLYTTDLCTRQWQTHAITPTNTHIPVRVCIYSFMDGIHCVDVYVTWYGPDIKIDFLWVSACTDSSHFKINDVIVTIKHITHEH